MALEDLSEKQIPTSPILAARALKTLWYVRVTKSRTGVRIGAVHRTLECQYLRKDDDPSSGGPETQILRVASNSRLLNVFEPCRLCCYGHHMRRRGGTADE